MKTSKKISAVLTKSKISSKKYTVKLTFPDGKTKTVNFGASGYSDFTKHKDPERKRLYDARHKRKENWGKSGIRSAGFWSKWLLWNKTSILASKKNISTRFGISFKKKN